MEQMRLAKSSNIDLLVKVQHIAESEIKGLGYLFISLFFRL
jgi:hypothetical protein